MGYQQSIEGCLARAIGAHGLSDVELLRWTERAHEGEDGLRQMFVDGTLPLLHIPGQTDDIAEVEHALDQLSDGAKTLVFFGTGGSSLGGQTLAQLAGWSIPGERALGDKVRPRTRFYDNLDARTLEKALGALNLETTRFVVTSKSGGTAETLCQTIVAIQACQASGLGSRIGELFLGLSEPRRDGVVNKLRDLLEPFGVPFLNHETGVGGRFSALTNVGLLPAMARGLSGAAIRGGAQEVLDDLLQGPDRDQASAGMHGLSAPGLGAAVTVGLMKEHGVQTSVLMAYSDRLGKLSDWFVQLWAESLGKQGEGSVALGATGPVDQHSQLQLFMDGPNSFMLTFLRSPVAGTGPVLDAGLCAKAGLDLMAGRAVGDLVDAQQNAVPEALIGAGRAVRTLDVDKIGARSIGAVMMHYMLETILAAHLLGIDPFDQPAVEVGKKLANARLSA